MNWSRLKKQIWLVSPRLENWQKAALTEVQTRVPRVKGMLWVLSSGTQSVHSVKAIGLTEEGIMASAESVNRHLESRASDRWMVAIPGYHVGGLSIYARAHLSGAEVVAFDSKWAPKPFVQALTQNKITLTSLVPTQIHDLVRAGQMAPKSLRAAIIGGGALEPWLYHQARSMDWPLLPSYGLSETCSQVATASLASLTSHEVPTMEILSHAQVDLRDQRVFVKASSVCRWVATARDGVFTLENPLRDGWLPTEDLGEWQGSELKILGRRDSVVKILGVLVPMQEVEFEAGEFFRDQGWDEPFAILPSPHARAGSQLVLVTDSSASLREWTEQIQAFNALVPGVRRISGPCWIPQVKRGELGKIKRGEIQQLLRGTQSS